MHKCKLKVHLVKLRPSNLPNIQIANCHTPACADTTWGNGSCSLDMCEAAPALGQRPTMTTVMLTNARYAPMSPARVATKQVQPSTKIMHNHCVTCVCAPARKSAAYIAESTGRQNEQRWSHTTCIPSQTRAQTQKKSYVNKSADEQTRTHFKTNTWRIT